MVFVTLIPVRRNDGSAVSGAEQQDIIRGLWRQFGGVTIEGQVTGHWIDDADGRHYQDDSLKVSVLCDTGRLPEAESVVREIGRRLGQRAMWFEVRYADGVRIIDVE
jgi:hypothetical protein